MTRISSVAALLLLMCCTSAPAPGADRTSDAAGFVNRVWAVRESSSVAPGTLYVFLEDGTLVITGPGSRPALGTWKYDGGGLTMVEESIPYRIEILTLVSDEFRIRSHNPGEPVDITLVPAETPPQAP